jgi:hypothetical protein
MAELDSATTALEDYPAAHSMDTTWFAVDQAGHVGIFFSGEDGPVPWASALDGDFDSFVRDLGGAIPEREEYDDIDWEILEEEAVDLGLFIYEYVAGFDPLLRPYTYKSMPGTPRRHVEQVPPRYRVLFKSTRFGGVLFPESDNIQPIEHMPRINLSFYGGEDVAYLAADETTVRPIPGKEDQFPAFCRRFRERYAERAEQLVFDGPQDEPEQPPKPRRRRKKDGGSSGAAEG